MPYESTTTGPQELSSDRWWWTPAQIAAEFGIGRSTVYDLISQGAFGPPLKISKRPGGGLRIHWDGIVKFVEHQYEIMSEEFGIFG